MDPTDLDHDEAIALVALVTFLVASNARATDAESATVRRVAQAVGRARYRELADEAAKHLPDEDTLRAFLSRIERPAARELLYETALEAATGDVIRDDEASFLGWLRRTWGLKVRIEPPPSGR